MSPRAINLFSMVKEIIFILLELVILIGALIAFFAVFRWYKEIRNDNAYDKGYEDGKKAAKEWTQYSSAAVAKVFFYSFCRKKGIDPVMMEDYQSKLFYLIQNEDDLTYPEMITKVKTIFKDGKNE